jgi:structural maintenance of chromosome 1
MVRVCSFFHQLLCNSLLIPLPFAVGKSNFMDAISFVMGEKTTQLRVRRLGELIHGASIGKPNSSRASVTAKFILPDEERTPIEFQRSVIGSSSDYKINGKVRFNYFLLIDLFF